MSPPTHRPLEGNKRIIFVGDVVGKPGIRILCSALTYIRREWSAAAIVVNAENAADGSGLRCKDYNRLIENGVDGITLGDHAFRKREIFEVLESRSNIVRPANLPEGAPGKGVMILELDRGLKIGVVSLLGRVFMKPVDCPYHEADRIFAGALKDVSIRLVDFHAEATSDMQLMGRYLDGRASAVLGTHTHVATADERVLPGGTAFQSDVGMTGPFESILGRKIDAVTEATLNALPTPFQVATEDLRINATWLDIDVSSGKCSKIGRIEIKEDEVNEYNAKNEGTKLL
ncbi:MAG: YmdB family metallophosphoesterase [Pirellulaceae bacterium]